MKTHFLTVLLAGLLAFSVLALSVLTFTYVQSVRKLHRLQAQAAEINSNRAKLQAMAQEALEYSKRNPAIDPLLQAVGIKPKTSPD